MGYFLDLVIVLIFVLYIFIGVKKGFIKTIVSLIGSFGALIAAGLLSRPIASGVFDLFFRGSLTETVRGALSKAGTAGTSAVTGDLLKELPGFLSGYIQAGDLEGQLQGAVGGAVDTAADTVVSVISPLFISFIQMIVFAVLFFVLTLVIRVFSRALEGVFRAPVLGGVNRVLGGALGALRAFIFCLLIGVILVIFVPLPGSEGGLLSETTMDQSVLFSYFYSTRNLVVSLFGGL